MKLLAARFALVVVFLQIVMEFRTKVDLPLKKITLTPRNRVLLLGSCFSDEIGRRLAAEMDGGCVLINPFGTLYNPTSILQALRALQTNRLPEGHLFKGRDGRWRSWAFGGKWAADTQAECEAKTRQALQQAVAFWQQADTVFITFGTNHVYHLKADGRSVANCHKELSSAFEERLLSIEDVVEAWQTFFRALPSATPRCFVFTLSPYRYIKYGLHADKLSKATLLLAIDRLCSPANGDALPAAPCFYFPSYEIVNDELRDYRFYAPDMQHPSEQTADYIWERLKEWSFAPADFDRMRQNLKAYKAALHRPQT
ncbi:GSCFA domain-containing protein [Alloprevotella tannerae]|uniref:GSCFA domain-containing protein n=2 Tax=Alloprevotella TaxID=1283313 RepID=UPI0028EBBC5F|nr:GSCFA domain-containing protein [Alloprevotella tannerae]